MELSYKFTPFLIELRTCALEYVSFLCFGCLVFIDTTGLNLVSKANLLCVGGLVLGFQVHIVEFLCISI